MSVGAALGELLDAMNPIVIPKGLHFFSPPLFTMSPYLAIRELFW